MAIITVFGTGVSKITVTVIQVQTNTKTLGNSDVYQKTSSAQERKAQIVEMPDAGTIQSISIYHSGGTGNMLSGIYSDVNGEPVNSLGLTTETIVNASAGWQTVYLIEPFTLSSGQRIWLSWIFESNAGIRYIEGEPARAKSTGTWTEGMPENFGSAVFFAYKYSLFCTYTTPTVGISKTSFKENEEVMIYPNPTEGDLPVKWKNRYHNILEIRIFNIPGKTVRQIQTDPEVNEIRLNPNKRRKRLYLFELKDPKNDLILNRSRIIKN